MRALIFTCLILLGCAPVITIRVVREEVGVRVDSVEVERVDSLFFLTRLDSLVHINDVRETIGKELLQDVKVALDGHFGIEIPDDYGIVQGYAYDEVQWSGDWINTVQLKLRVKILASYRSAYVTLRWKFNRGLVIWELQEVIYDEEIQ